MKQRIDASRREAALRFEYELDAPLAKVWRAVTIPELVARWLMKLPNEPEFEASNGENAAPALSPQVSLHLLDSEPCRSVRYGWSEDGGPFLGNVVTFRLRENDSGGTTFSIVHELTQATRASADTKAANHNRPALLLAA